MSTLIENINKITEIKQDLNQVLRDNGLEGGNVFSDYPDKFRELFRVMTSITDSTVEGYKAPETTVITVVPDPTLSQYQNIVYVTNNLDEATIYYYVKTVSGKNDIGVTSLEKGKSIIVSEPSTVYVYAQYRAQRSNTVNIFVPWSAEIVPDPPVISRVGTTVTITCNEGDEIYYNISDEFVLYTGPITVERTVDVYAFTQNYRGRSDTVIDEAPEKPVKPEIPDISCSMNVVTITCDTPGATIYYKRTTDQYWIEYTGPFTITQSGYYITKSIANDLQSDESDAVWCEYLVTPARPTINTASNTVYINCSTPGASIYYREVGGDWILYTRPITLTQTITIEAYAIKSGIASRVTGPIECEYTQPIDLRPAVPTFSSSNNIVNISCSTPNAIIFYREAESAGEWIQYSGPFEINETKTYEAYSFKNGYYSDVSEPFETVYVPPVVKETVATPVISCSNNRVSISCSTIDAVIWYRNYLNANWMRYTGPFNITQDTTFVAYASKEDWNDSEMTQPTLCQYIYNPVVIPDEPYFETFENEKNKVYIRCATKNATIYYTINGSDPIEYVAPISFGSDVEITSWSYLNGQISENVTQIFYVQYPQAPVISNVENNVTITSPDGGVIYYMIDEPETKSAEYPINWGIWQIYTEPIWLYDETTVHAEVLQWGVYSDTTDYEYVPLVPQAPVIENNYNTITITSLDGGVIYYAIDDGEYSVYSSSFNITEDCTVKAYIFKWNTSSEISELECVFDENYIWTPWYSAEYYYYTTPANYTDITSTNQFYNQRKKVADISDVLRFCLYTHNNNKYILMQFSDGKFAKGPNKSSRVRFNSNDFFTTTDINKSAPLQTNYRYFIDKNTINNFTPRQVELNTCPIKIAKFYKDVHYVGDVSGTCLRTFGIAQLDGSMTTQTIYINTLHEYLTYAFGYTNQMNISRTGMIRFAPKDRIVNTGYKGVTNNFPFDISYCSMNINGVQFYGDHGDSRYYSDWSPSAYEVELKPIN